MPPPSSTQNTRGCARALPNDCAAAEASFHATIRSARQASHDVEHGMSCRQGSACPHSPKTMAGQFNEDVFQGRLTKGHSLNHGGKGSHHIAYERMAMVDFAHSRRQ